LYCSTSIRVRLRCSGK